MADQITEQAALLALLQRTKRWSTVADEVEDAGSAVEFLVKVTEGATTTTEGQDGLFAAIELDVDPLLAGVREQLSVWSDEGIGLVTLLDPAYPSQLLTIHQRPPFLFYRGRIDPSDTNSVAIVGTRQASARGIRQAEELAEGLAARGVAVVSGLAAGIDAAAHRGALRSGGRTVAVIGTGIRRSYPKENASLQERIGEVGLVVSQFMPDSPPTKSSFPMRNAVMSGYSAATVVVEAPWKSGARMQARLALEHGRSVFLLDTLMEHDWACDYAKRPGATVVSGVEDVLAALDAIVETPDRLVWT